MRMIIFREELLRALSLMQGLFDKRHPQPILSHVHLYYQSDSDLLKIRSTDLDMDLSLSLEAECLWDDESAEKTLFSVLLPARKCLDIVRSLPEREKIFLDFKENKIELQTAFSRYLLSSMASDLYPLFEKPFKEDSFFIQEGALKKIIDHTKFSMMQHNGRQQLNALYMECQDDQLKAVASDGHRLVIHELLLNKKSSHQDVLALMIPQKAILELQRLLKDSLEELELSFDKNTVSVQSSSFFFRTKRVLGRYPSYQSLLTREGEKPPIIIHRESLKQSLQRSSAVLHEKNQGAFFKFSENRLHIYARNTQKDESEESLAIHYQGETFEIALNIVYLLEYLNIIKTTEVLISIVDDQHPCCVKPQGVFYPDHQNTYFIMPMCL